MPCARFNIVVLMTVRIVVESGKVQTFRKDFMTSAKR
jgi:hypothetical protein